MQRGGDGELCLTIPISTRVMCCGSLLGVQDVIALNILFIYCFIYFFFTGIPRIYRHSQQELCSAAACTWPSCCILHFFLTSQLAFCVPFVFRAGVLIIHPRSETSPAGFWIIQSFPFSLLGLFCYQHSEKCFKVTERSNTLLLLGIGVKPGQDWGFADKFDFLLHTKRQDWKL